ncbi:flagellar hook-basal body complex protein [bacterium]|nr:flagellar hook-basal body complex protein [bacterium]
MLGVFTTGLTGVNAHQQWLDNIANNVSNVNADGYKKTRTTFAELMSNSVGQATAPEGDCTMGGLNPKQIGTGVGNATMETIFTSGATKSTDNVTDLALQGDGFFVVNGGGTDLYTRNGNFGFDADGNLTYKANGFKAQGV